MFFEPPPPAEAQAPPKQPPWAGPPARELGVAVPVRAVLARGDDVVVAITDCVAYSNGFELGLSTRTRMDNFSPAWLHGGPVEPGKPLPPELLRFGVQFADGRKGTSLGMFSGGVARAWFKASSEGREPELPEGPLMMPRGGGGGGRTWDQRYWVWPLPPEGPLQVVVEWPAKGIPLTMHELDGAAIRAAAAQSTRLWEDDEGPGPSSWTTSAIRS